MFSASSGLSISQKFKTINSDAAKGFCSESSLSFQDLQV